MSVWPEALVEELASRRAIPFLGSGASASAQNAKGERPPAWRQLLERARDKLVLGSDDQAEATRLIAKGQLLDAAEVIFREVNGAVHLRFMEEVFVKPGYAPSRIHRLVSELDSKYTITTNYDT